MSVNHLELGLASLLIACLSRSSQSSALQKQQIKRQNTRTAHKDKEHRNNSGEGALFGLAFSDCSFESRIGALSKVLESGATVTRHGSEMDQKVEIQSHKVCGTNSLSRLLQLSSFLTAVKFAAALAVTETTPKKCTESALQNGDESPRVGDGSFGSLFRLSLALLIFDLCIVR